MMSYFAPRRISPCDEMDLPCPAPSSAFLLIAVADRAWLRSRKVREYRDRHSLYSLTFHMIEGFEVR